MYNNINNRASPHNAQFRRPPLFYVLRYTVLRAQPQAQRTGPTALFMYHDDIRVFRLYISLSRDAAASEFRRQNGHLHDAVCRGRHAGGALGQEEEHTGTGIGRGLRASVRRTAPRAPVVHELKVDRLCVVHFNQESDTPAFRLWQKGAAARVRRVRKTLVTWHSGAKGVHPNHS